MAKLIRLKLYICDFYENLDQKTMEVIIHRALNGIAGNAMTDIFEIEEKAITWADDNPINQLNATQETWDEQFGSKDAQAARIAELEAERDHFREVAEKLVWLYSDEHQGRLDNGLRIDGFYSHEWLGMILDMAREAMKGAGA